MKQTTLILAAALAAVGGAVGGMMLAMDSSSQGTPAPAQANSKPALRNAGNTPLRAFKSYPEPRVVADFALTDQRGEPFDLSRWKGQWTLVFFGFTHCPDICPSTMALMSEVLDQADLGPALAVTFVSVDPERDTPQQLADYIAFFDSRFDAATGPRPQLVALTHQLGVLFDIEPHDEGAGTYNVDHSASVLLFNPAGRLLGQFPAPHRIEPMVSDLKQLIGSRRQ